MASEKKRLLENFISLGALQIFSYVIPLVTLPYLSRVLGADRFGLAFFAIAFIEYFRMFTDFGFNWSASREIAVNCHNKKNLSNIFNSVMFVKMILLIFALSVFLIVIFCIPKLKNDIWLFLFAFLIVIGNLIYPVWFFQGIEHMKYITSLNILAKTVFLILIFIFIKDSNDYVLVPLLNGLGFLVSGVIGFISAITRFNIKIYIPRYKSIKKQFLYSSQFFIANISTLGFTTTNTFILGLLSSNAIVGYYVAAEKIFSAVKGLSIPIRHALYPYIAKYKDIKTYKKIFKITIWTSIMLSLFVFIFSENIITIFYGNNLIYAYKILKIFSIGIFISWTTMMLNYPLLGAIGHTREVNNSVIYVSLLHLLGLLILYLTKCISVYSISILVLLTESILLSITIFYVCKFKALNEKEY